MIDGPQFRPADGRRAVATRAQPHLAAPFSLPSASHLLPPVAPFLDPADTRRSGHRKARAGQEAVGGVRGGARGGRGGVGLEGEATGSRRLVGHVMWWAGRSAARSSQCFRWRCGGCVWRGRTTRWRWRWGEGVRRGGVAGRARWRCGVEVDKRKGMTTVGRIEPFFSRFIT